MGVSSRDVAHEGGDHSTERRRIKSEIDDNNSEIPNRCSSRYSVVKPHVDNEGNNEKRPPVKLTVRLTDGIRPCQVRVVNSSIPTEVLKNKRIKLEGEYEDVKFKTAKKLDISMDSETLFKAVKEMGHGNGNISTSITGNESSYLPKVNKASLTKEELLPETPCIYVNSKEEAFSPQLYEFCLQRPIIIIRNLTAMCDIDLSHYSTKALVDAYPNHPVEVRLQMEQSSDENWNANMTEEVWYCTSSRSYSTLAKMAEYQASTLEEYFNSKTVEKKTFNPPANFTKSTTRKMIKFGTNCDLSDEKKWASQQKELMKLPAWLRVVSAGNMLSHIGNQILGMNTVQLYLKVPRSRTPGHQENNNFCAVNINIGPGDSEWFGVPDTYWGSIQKMCIEKKVDYLHGSWWPKIEDLVEAGIPTYRFMQKPGDIVWVNAGCVHWVQAAGWCNNIAWNVGPMTSRQYKLAIERYEWNKKERFQSIVAMVFLSWNLARNIKISNADFFVQLKTTLMHSLRQIIQSLEFINETGAKIRFHGRRKNEPAHYCGVCDEEVFNILFVKENEKRHVVHCLRCVRQFSPELSGVVCLEEFPLSELFEVYDNLRLVS